MGTDPYEHIEVAGRLMQSYVNGFKSFTLVASRFLAAEGFTERDAAGVICFDVNRWYPMTRSLRAIHRAGNEAGDAVVRQIGQAIATGAAAPVEMKTVADMVLMVNAGYHLNHRKHGKVMFDPQTRTLLPGIGGFAVRQLAKDAFEVECNNPYPCAFDLGIFEGGVRRFGGAALVSHLDDRPCRKKGAASCTLMVRLVASVKGS